MTDAIFTINNYSNKYESKYSTTYFQQTKKYDESELNCCSDLLNYLENYLCYIEENEYDIVFTKFLLSNKII